MRTRAVAAAAVLVVLTAACAGTPVDAASDGAGTGDARTVEDQYGTVEITGTPERVVTSGNTETDIAVALGVIPVAMGQWFDEEDGSSPWRRELLDGARPELIRWNPDGYDVEETLAFDPDLVLAGFDLAAEPHAQLSAVVPTISMPYEISGEELTRAIGTALGREEEAEQLIADATDEVQRTAAELDQLDGATIAILDGAEPGALHDATAMTLRHGMLEQLGLEPAAAVADLADYTALSAEDWGSLDADVLVVNYWDEAVQAEFEADPLFQRIPAVAAGRYLPLPDPNDTELLQSASPPQVRYALEHLVPRIADLLG